MVRKKLADLLWNYPGDRPRESRETGIPAHPWVVIMIHNHILIWNIKLPFHFLGQTYIGHKASLICLLFETMQLYWEKNIYLLVFFSSFLTSEDTSFTQILLVPGIGSKWAILTIFQRFFSMGCPMWAATMLYDQGITLRRSGHPTCPYFGPFLAQMAQNGPKWPKMTQNGPNGLKWP